MIQLDFVSTLAAAGLVLFAGYGLQRRVGLLARHNIPAPVVGGLLVALGITLLRASGHQAVTFDTTLQAPLMIAFFTSIGFGASVPLLRSGGPAVAVFLALATAAAVLQNLAGAAVAAGLGVPPLLGVLAGSVTLTGGPATGLAFAPLFEQAGVKGASTLAVASAMVGIVAGGIIGGPIGTFLIERRRLRPAARAASPTPSAAVTAGDTVLALEPPDPLPPALAGEDPGARALLKGIVSLLAAMAVGSWIGTGFTAAGVTLPAYIGAMLAAAALRNLDDVTGWIRLPHRLLDDLGNAALALFIAMALMTLRLWEIANLALPLAVILAVQVALIAALCFWPTFRLMGRDYDAAVMSSGFCGFMLGTTANAMANMGVLTEKYGPAPRAYLVVPMVGAFFIDFTNAVIITMFLNFWR
ncbi:MAG TPA: sodium/glutamate symporter [Vicinamibacteria bacterium]|nr:sodium/glutamate symporter [Vicinamibacteria bacterium]